MRLRVLATLPVGLLVLTGCGEHYGGGVRAEDVETPARRTGGLLSSVSTREVVRVWFWRHGRLRPVMRTVSGGSDTLGAAALQALLDGPTGRERARGFRTMIPVDTELRGEPDVTGGRAVVNLSAAFLDRPPAVRRPGDAVELYKLAQVVYTLTSFPGVESARVLVDDRPLGDSDGSADLDEPGLTRLLIDANANSPRSGELVCDPVPTGPLPGDLLEVTQPSHGETFDDGVVRWSGHTRALTGNVAVQLLDGEAEVRRLNLTASCVGRFSGFFTPPPTLAGPLTLRVSLTSPTDGHAHDSERREIVVG